MYLDAIKACTCQLWVKRFKDSDCDISKKNLRKQPALNETICIGSTSKH